MKKRLPFILVFLILIVGVGLIIYNSVYVFKDDKQQHNNSIVEDVEQKDDIIDKNDDPLLSSTPEIMEEDKLELQEEKEITKNDDVPTIKEETSEKQETTTNQKVEENTTSSSSNNSSNNDSNNDNVDNTPIEEEQEVIVPEDEFTPQVDPEYERLKSLIKYKTDMECYNASFDVSLEYNDDENFQVASCYSYAYKGELLGYRMAVHFWDGTTIYLDAID